LAQERLIADQKNFLQKKARLKKIKRALKTTYKKLIFLKAMKMNQLKAN